LAAILILLDLLAFHSFRLSFSKKVTKKHKKYLWGTNLAYSRVKNAVRSGDEAEKKLTWGQTFNYAKEGLTLNIF